MNTRILRMAERLTAGGCFVRGLGRLQPVLFTTRDGVPRLSCEGVERGRPCIWKYPLPH